MFKLAAKVSIFMFLAAAGSMFLAGGKVAADACPANMTQAMNGTYGVPAAQNGGHGGNMAGMVVRAVDADNGQDLGVSYTLHSALYPPDANGAHTGTVTGTNGQPQQQDLNARIFQDDNSTGHQPANAVNNLRETTGDRGCAGWNAWGPSGTGQNSLNNGYVLDCGIINQDTGTTLTPTEFWFDNVTPRPTGDTTDNGQNGYWEVKIVSQLDPNAGGQVQSTDIAQYTPGSMGYLNHSFHVGNGYNTQVTFLWHPASTQHPPQSSGSGNGVCQNFTGNETIGNTRVRVFVSITGVNNGKIVYTDGNGNNSTFGGSGGDVSGWVGPGGENGDTSNPAKSVSKTWYYQPNQNDITIQYRTDTYNTSSKSRNIGTPTTNTINCFVGKVNNCTAGLSAVGDGPNNVVVSNGTVHITGYYVNSGQLPLYYPSLIGSDGGQYAVHGLNGDGTLNPGQVGTIDFYITAPTVSNPIMWGFTLTPAYFGVMGPPSCPEGVNIPVYAHFTAQVKATSTLSPTTEDPSNDAYSTTVYINETSYPVNIPTSNSFCIKKVSGPSPPCLTVGGGTYQAPSTTSFSGNSPIAPGSFAAGDEYCSSIYAAYTSGYVGLDSNVVGGIGPASDSSCPMVANEPYFKVHNSSVSAGGDFDQCTNSGGTLAGYNNNSDAGSDRGSSTQLSALALLKITGVASGETVGTLGNGGAAAARLTFANSSAVEVDSSSLESPVLGGQFVSCQTLTNERLPSTHSALSGASTNVSTLTSGAYTSARDTTLTSGVTGGTMTMTPNHNVSLFVTGNVYINSNIVYNNTGAALGTVPSLVIHATGNIYIDPSVTNLSGVFIAQKKADNTAGKIYTCSSLSNHFAAMAASDLYASCNKQLVVYGSFVADQVNLMRTFGSLRDETPTQAVATINSSKNGKDYDPGTCSQPGQTPNGENSCFANGNAVSDL
jgi:hypothetical protein